MCKKPREGDGEVGLLIHCAITSFYVPPMQSFPMMWVLVLAGFFYFYVYKGALAPSFVSSEILMVVILLHQLSPNLEIFELKICTATYASGFAQNSIMP